MATRAVARRALVGQLPPKIRLRSDKGNLGPNFIRGLLAEQVTFRKSVLKEQKNIQAYSAQMLCKVCMKSFLKRKKASADEISLLLLIAVLWRKSWVSVESVPWVENRPMWCSGDGFSQ